MNKPGFVYVNSQQYELELFLKSRKNLIVYDGLRDGLEKNICTKYFYSSPSEALEFINIDIFRLPEYKMIGSETKRIFGSIYIIRDRIHKHKGTYVEEFGIVKIEDIVIRDISKSRITLYIGDEGIANIQSLVEYFELNYCIKSFSL